MRLLPSPPPAFVDNDQYTDDDVVAAVDDDGAEGDLVQVDEQVELSEFDDVVVSDGDATSMPQVDRNQLDADLDSLFQIQK